jgi:rRNA-processing protein EBP2
VEEKEAGEKDDGGEEAEDPSASEAESDSDVPLSDLSEDERADTISHQRMTINNGPALKTSTARIRLIKPHLRFSAHNSLISSLPPSSTAIPDPNDDLTRELEFYRIARAAATKAMALLKKEGVPFTRPSDYFAEMAKSDEQMEKVKRKMRDEAASKKAAAEARALRDAKRFGKAVQVAKVQERAREKREVLEKISTLKRST